MLKSLISGKSVIMEIKLSLPTRNIKEMNNPVEALKINEFLITCLRTFLFFEPIEYPTIPSVEKAYASKINADSMMRFNKIVFAATTSSPMVFPK